jgi:tetratricopeptide (TPR) repeat protein
MAPVNDSTDGRKHRNRKAMSTDKLKRVPSSELMSAEGNISVAVELSRRGHEEQARGNHVRALTLMKRSLAIVDSLLPSSPEAAVILSSIGILSQEAGIGSGLKYHSRALQIRSNVQPETCFEAESQEFVGMSLVLERQYKQALQYLKKALAFHESMNARSLMTAIQHIHVGQARQGMGEAREAVESFKGALSILSELAPGSLDVASVHYLLGRALREIEDIDAAKEQLGLAVAIYDEKSPASLEISNAYVELGRVHDVENGGKNQAMAYFAKALEIQDAVAPYSLEIASTFHHIAVFHISSGNHEAGRSYLLQAISIQNALSPFSLDHARSLYEMGELCAQQGQYEDAFTHHQRALELRSQLQPLTPEEADSLHAVGILIERRGNWEEALGYFSREFLGRNVDAVETARVHNKIGNILLRETNRVGDAIYNHRMAVRIQSNHEKDTTLVMYLTDLITALNANGESDEGVKRKLGELQMVMPSVSVRQMEGACKSFAPLSGRNTHNVPSAQGACR